MAKTYAPRSRKKAGGGKPLTVVKVLNSMGFTVGYARSAEAALDMAKSMGIKQEDVSLGVTQTATFSQQALIDSMNEALNEGRTVALAERITGNGKTRQDDFVEIW